MAENQRGAAEQLAGFLELINAADGKWKQRAVNAIENALTAARQEALEEAAKVADSASYFAWDDYVPSAGENGKRIAKYIRALATVQGRG